MEIILGKTAGFCNGITRAVEKAEEELQKVDKIECLGDLLHNSQVLNKLKNEGLIVINNIEEAKEKVIIRAHGVKKDVYTYAEEHNVELIDCTCPKVLKIHKTAEELSNENYYIIVIGEKDHAEVVGTFSFCKNGEIIQNIEELKSRVETLNKKDKIAVLTQTTYNLQKFFEIEKYLKENITTEIKICNGICNATEIRQKETEEISKKVDYMIIIGGKKSSNTNKLYEISQKNCKRAIKIEEVTELYNEDFKNISKIGVMAGASTPRTSIEAVINYLKERK
jgi:(E)-4-hydroxy-3-methyl-but-2-enyl pyrophosphate reductase